MAAVLKSEQLSRGSDYPQAVVFNVEDVQTRAREYLIQVQREAAEILAAAQAEAVRIRAQAQEQGVAQAQATVEQKIQTAAQQLSDARCKTAIAACEATVEKLTKETSQWLAVWRTQTVDLATKIAERILRREMSASEETLRVWMEEAIVAMRDVRDIRVLVHPDDFAVAGRFLQNLAKSVPQAAQVEVLPDPEISLGGCIVRSSHGQLDQQLETQLQRLAEQLQ
jgi:flagellar biosynthesis/type III secretory pathway protein FliH